MTKKAAKEQKVGTFEDAPIEVLTPDEMARADSMTIEAGTAGYDLMLAAGRAVTEAAMAFGGSRILVLAGPGNNGGDGFVAARMLQDAGRNVRVALWGRPENLRGDAAKACADYSGTIELAGDENADDIDLDADLIIDALFGAGLSRGLDGALGRLVERVNRSGARVLAVDLPSGVDGATGQIAGRAIEADRTITFFRLKPGHLLYPGRGQCGETRLAQIGIAEDVLAHLDVHCFLNSRALWQSEIPKIGSDTHKYRRGHVLVVSGPWANTGASRLAAMAALRCGAGLVTVAADGEAARIHAAHLTAIMIRQCDGPSDLQAILEDSRFTAVAVGPAAGITGQTRDMVMTCLRSDAAIVLDADALTVFADDPTPLFSAIGDRDAPVVMTPHAGEFARLFPDLAEGLSGGGRIERAGEAAARSGATLVLKGADTVVAAPAGPVSISANAPPWLATAGSGDVLTGIVTGLLAQGMPAFPAASAAVWMHAEAARAFGPGLTADDLPGELPPILRKVYIYD
jgi:hydroxyethylthiazole kinase-like uncharacterized protein yjeF